MSFRTILGSGRRRRSWQEAFVVRDVFDELAVARHPDACKHETGYPSVILRELFERYRGDIFDDPYPLASGYGRATQDEVYFFLVFKYIHVRGRGRAALPASASQPFCTNQLTSNCTNQLHPKVREFPNTLRVAGQMEGISYHSYCTKVLPIALRLANVISEIYWEERLSVS
jgi:hypothetical protein